MEVLKLEEKKSFNTPCLSKLVVITCHTREKVKFLQIS